MSAVKGVLVALASALAVLIGPSAAGAATFAGEVVDPADRPGEADVAAASVRYDDAGSVLLRVRFHQPVETEDPTTIEWVVRPATGPDGCAATHEGVAGLLEPRTGDTTLTYTDIGPDGIPVEVEMAARQTMSADRRELTVAASSASLTRRTLRCSRIEVSNRDVVARILLEALAGAPAGEAPPGDDGEIGGEGQRPVGGLRVSGVRLAFERRGRRVTGTLRARVCAPAGMRILSEVRERRRRHGRTRFGREHVHRYTRRQRLRCQVHRWSWRLRADPAARYRVVVRLRVRALGSPPPAR